MRFFRNPEVKRTFAVFLLLTAAATGAAYFLGARFALFTLFVCVLFSAVSLAVTYKRYRVISDLSADVNRILHGDSQLSLERYSEGELAVLQTEVQKMTVRLREQGQRLLEDKVYLADSIADISHQIRTPLTTINLLVSFLEEPNITEERRAQLTHELYEQLSRIDWLITALLKISKLDAGTVQFNKETVSLSSLIERSTASLLVPIELREQTLTVNASGNFCGDISWTAEGLANILKNCMEHTEKGGKIQVTAAENALYSEIIICDNGGGIDKEDLPHIFERFYKGKNSDEKSFGIGLALARMIITAQNGTVKAENSMEGAVFTVRFFKGVV